jgi:glutamate dehydrogenase (NADP+)
MLKTRGESIRGKTCLVSGSGNVALFTVENINRLGGKAVTLSDSDGCIFDKDGIDQEKLEWVKQLKTVRRGRIREYAEQFGCEYVADERPWAAGGAQCAFPSATQNEIDLEDAKRLTADGVYVVSEGANMPTRPDAIEYFLEQGVFFGPGKAANAGGVATSGLEMS